MVQLLLTATLFFHFSSGTGKTYTMEGAKTGENNDNLDTSDVSI
jgi:hypothetical protein